MRRDRRVNILRWIGATGDEYFAFSCPRCGWVSATLFAASECYELHCEACEATAQGQLRLADLLGNCGAEFLTDDDLDAAAQDAIAAGVRAAQ